MLQYSHFKELMPLPSLLAAPQEVHWNTEPIYINK